jgi:hypothetical protein
MRRAPFLEYTLESNILWTCCIGVPYGTSVWQLGDSAEQNGTFKIESKKANAETVRCKIRAGLPATLESSDIVRIVNIPWQKLFAKVHTNLKAIADHGCPPLNYVLLDKPELQEMKGRAQSINDIYEQHVMAGVEITALTLFNTDKGSVDLTMDVFLDNTLQEKALGKLTAAEKVKVVPIVNVEDGRRRLVFCWPRDHHRWLRHRFRLPRVGSPYSF